MSVGLWSEKYRPISLEQVSHHQDILDKLRIYVENKQMPHQLFVGPRGVGKTTCLLALANDLSGARAHVREIYPEEDFLHLPGSSTSSYDFGDYKKDLKNFTEMAALHQNIPFRIILIHNAHKTKERNFQQFLRRTMEMYSNTCRFCLETHNKNEIIDPILSRCDETRFDGITKKEMKTVLMDIAQKEDVILTEDGLNTIHQSSDGNLRTAINRLQAASAKTNGFVSDESIYSLLRTDLTQMVKRMLDSALNNKFIEARKILRQILIDMQISEDEILTKMDKEIMRSTTITKRDKIELQNYIAKVDYNLTQAGRPEIQLSTLLAKLGTLSEN